MQTCDKKLVLLEAFYRKVRVFKEAFTGINDTRIVLAILHEVFNFVEAIEKLEKK